MLSLDVTLFSAIDGTQKKIGFETWKAYSDATPAFCMLCTQQENISEEDAASIERFVVLLYRRTCPLSRVNHACQVLFAQGTRSIENIPPTHGAILGHTKRAPYQAGRVWGADLCSQAGATHPRGLELGTNHWRMVTKMANTTRSNQVIPTTDPLWLHEGLQRTVQVL